MSRARHKAKGGATMGVAYAGGDSNVAKEAKERKRGGKVCGEGDAAKPHPGRAKRASGGSVPGRKRGGSVGADRHPLSSAATISHKDEVSS